MSREKLLLTTPRGRYVWWRELEIVDFIPKGKRTASDTRQTRDHTFLGALKVALKMEGLTLGDYKDDC